MTYLKLSIGLKQLINFYKELFYYLLLIIDIMFINPKITKIETTKSNYHPLFYVWYY